jgi:hypothetical protein
VPGTRDVSFPLHEPDGTYRFFVLAYGSRQPQPLIDAIGEGQDAAWADDTLLMASAATIYAATPRRSALWRPVVDLSDYGLGAITRIAVSPTHDRIAFVAARQKP